MTAQKASGFVAREDAEARMISVNAVALLSSDLAQHAESC
jgi:hypothetical protein